MAKTCTLGITVFTKMMIFCFCFNFFGVESLARYDGIRRLYLLTFLGVSRVIGNGEDLGQITLVEKVIGSNSSEIKPGDLKIRLDEKQEQIASSEDVAENVNLTRNNYVGSEKFVNLNSHTFRNTTSINNKEEEIMVSQGTIAVFKTMADTSTITKSYNSSESEFLSKSKLYEQMMKSLPLFLSKHELEDISCQNRCGESLECSCKPTCFYFKTCCVDFLTECSDIFDMTQMDEKYRWLESVEKECLSYSPAVTSCYPGMDPTKNISHDYVYDNINVSQDPQDTDLKGEHKLTFSNSSKEIAISDVIQYFLSNTQGLDEYEQYLEQMFTRTPVLDTSTGISYRNVSLYICNRANLRHAVLWEAFYPLNTSILLPSSKTQTVRDIFDLIDRWTLNKIWPIYRNLGSSELCNDEAIDSCPEGYKDRQLNQACKTVNLHITSFLQVRGNLWTDVYKNPFCLYCHKAKDPDYDIESSSLMKYGQLRIPFSFLKFSFSKTTFTVTLMNRYTNYVLGPNWSTLKCRFAQPSNKSHLESPSTNQMISSECRIIGCPWININNMCLRHVYYILALPPTVHKLSEDFFSKVLAEWKHLMLNSVPFTSNPTNDSDNIKVLRQPALANGYNYQYVLSISLLHDIFNQQVILNMLRRPLLEMLSKFDFPFSTGHYYVCHTVKRVLMGGDRNSIGIEYCKYSSDMLHITAPINVNNSIWQMKATNLFKLITLIILIQII